MINNDSLQKKISSKFRLYFPILVLLYLVYFLLAPWTHYLADPKAVFVIICIFVPILFGFYLAEFPDSLTKEGSILLLYYFWILFTRIVNRDPVLSDNLSNIYSMMLMALFLAPGIILEGKKRKQLFFLLAGIYVLLYLGLGVLAIYTAITRTSITSSYGYILGYLKPSQFRILTLCFHSNIFGGHFMFMFCLSIILVFTAKSIPGKILFVISAVVDLITVALTVSRNAQTFVSLALALVISIAIVYRIRNRKKWQRILVFVVSVLLITPLSYQVYEPIRHEIWNIYESNTLKRETDSKAETMDSDHVSSAYQLLNLAHRKTGNDSLQTMKASYRADKREYFDSGRKEIFWSAIESLRLEPKRLLIGCKIEDVVKISNTLIKEQATHFHNSFLQVVNLYGLVGLVLVVLFSVCILIRGYRLVFSCCGARSLTDCLMVVPIICLIGYSFLEPELYTKIDMSTGFYFYICGILIGSQR